MSTDPDAEFEQRGERPAGLKPEEVILDRHVQLDNDDGPPKEKNHVNEKPRDRTH